MTDRFQQAEEVWRSARCAWRTRQPPYSPPTNDTFRLGNSDAAIRVIDAARDAWEREAREKMRDDILAFLKDQVYAETIHNAIVSRFTFPDSSEHPTPMMGEPDGSVRGFMCLTDWECEIGAASGGNTVHPSVGDIKRSRRCVDGCGIMEVRMTGVKVIQQPILDEDEEDEA